MTWLVWQHPVYIPQTVPLGLNEDLNIINFEFILLRKAKEKTIKAWSEQGELSTLQRQEREWIASHTHTLVCLLGCGTHCSKRRSRACWVNAGTVWWIRNRLNAVLLHWHVDVFCVISCLTWNHIVKVSNVLNSTCKHIFCYTTVD